GKSKSESRVKDKANVISGNAIGRRKMNSNARDDATHVVLRDKGKRKTASTAATKMPKNLNAIKDIKNNKLVCNNVVVDVEGCYEPMIVMDDIVAPNFPKFSMNDVENSVVQWICE